MTIDIKEMYKDYFRYKDTIIFSHVGYTFYQFLSYRESRYQYNDAPWDI